MTNEIKPVKYFISGWNAIIDDDGTWHYEPFKRLIDDEALARQYLMMMTHRNSPSMRIKIDNIECIWNAD